MPISRERFASANSVIDAGTSAGLAVAATGIGPGDTAGMLLDRLLDGLPADLTVKGALELVCVAIVKLVDQHMELALIGERVDDLLTLAKERGLVPDDATT